MLRAYLEVALRRREWQILSSHKAHFPGYSSATAWKIAVVRFQKLSFIARMATSIYALNVLLFTSLPAQELHFSFKHLTTDQGLASNKVNAVAQDSQGYIWIGTSDGLQRYDGIRFRHFRRIPEEGRTLPSNMILGLYAGQQNRLWVMCGEGDVGIFDTRKLAFRKIDIHEAGKMVKRPPEARFIADGRGNIFILGIKGGLYIWDEQKGHFRTCRFPAPALEGWRATGLAPLPGAPGYIVSFGPQGLFWWNTQGGAWSEDEAVLEPLRLTGYPEGTAAYNLLADQKGRLWAQFWPHLYHTPKIYSFILSGQQVLISDYEPAELVGGYIETAPFFESRAGAIWVYGSDIFARYNETMDTFQLVHNGYDNSRPILYHTINTLFEDRENTKWVGTNDNGLFTFNPGREYFRNIGHVNRHTKRRGRGSPTGFIQLADSTILVSVWGDGLYRYDRQWNELPFDYSGGSDIKNMSIWSMSPSQREGAVWMSSQPGRAIRYDQQANTMEVFRAGILENNTVRQVVEDRNGNLWLGMQRIGLLHWKCNKDGRPAAQGPSAFESVPGCTINKMITDREGLLWVATENQGLYVIDPSAGKVALHLHDTHTDPNYRLPGPGASSVLDYNDSLVVISGISSLLAFNRNQRTLTRISVEEALAGYIAGLAPGPSGNVWISTTSGLYRANIHTGALLKFGRPDGIDDENFVLASSYTLPDGRMLFGASETFVVFDPAVFNAIEIARPEAVLTGLQVNNRMVLIDSVEGAGELRLRHFESALSIEFSTLEFHRRNRIRYKMEGLDPDWQASENNLAVYSYLPAGSYRFLLQPIYADGTPGPIRPLNIIRNPPFWQAWWFYSLLCLAGGGILFLFDRERMRRRNALQQVRTKIAAQLHTEVRTVLNSIHILSEMAAIKAKKGAAGAAGLLGQINRRSQQMMEAMDDMLWAVAPENDSMARVVERIEAYVHELQSEGRVNIGLLVGPEVSEMALDMQARQLLLRLVKTAVEGLLRAGARNLQVFLGREKMQLNYVIEFDKAEADRTALNNFLQSGEMVGLLSDMEAMWRLEVLEARGVLSYRVPL